MKSFCLFLMVLLLLSGCVATGVQHGSGTIIGLRAGMPDGASVVIGFQRYEAISCEKGCTADITANGTITATGMEGESHARFGSEDITVNDKR